MSNWTRYTNAFTGHPTLSGTAGDLTTLLDAILVNGTTAQSVTSITRSGTTATLTCAAHGVPIGDIVERSVAGAVETDYNGTYQMTAATSTTFTYTVANSPTTPATGTITYATPGRGWTIAFTGTNKRAYYMGSGAAARKYMRINDAAAGTGGAKEALVKGFNTMTTVDAGTGPFPAVAQSALTENSQVIRKSTTADGTARTWDAWADDRTLILLTTTADSGTIISTFYFGEYESSATGDTTACLIAGRTAENSAVFSTVNVTATESAAQTISGVGAAGGQKYTCGDINGFNASTACWNLWSPLLSVSTAQSIGIVPYPNPIDGGLYLVPMLLYRTSAVNTPSPIGKLRGVFASGHPLSTFANNDIFSGAGDFAGRIFIVKGAIGNAVGNTQQIFVENGTNPPHN